MKRILYLSLNGVALFLAAVMFCVSAMGATPASLLDESAPSDTENCFAAKSAVEDVSVYTSIGTKGRQIDRIVVTASCDLSNVTVDEVHFTNAVRTDGSGKIDFSLTTEGNKLILDVSSLSPNGKSFLLFFKKPWSVRFSNHKELNFSVKDIDAVHTEVLDNCIRGTHTYAGISRDYVLYLPQNADGGYKTDVPLMVWNIGGTEYDQTIDQMIDANQSLVTMYNHQQDCAVLVVALDHPNYAYSASLDPEKIKLIDRDNALQADLIRSLIQDGTVDANHVYCVGASSGGGATMRFIMQFPELFAAAVPICSMDPIVPIHQVQGKTIEDFTAELVEAFQGQVYRWDGTDMVLSDIDTEAFLALPVYFTHAENDQVCKVTSSRAMYAARQQLGAKNDRIRIYDDAYMERFGVADLFKHASWVPALSEFDADSPMGWMLAH